MFYSNRLYETNTDDTQGHEQYIHKALLLVLCIIWRRAADCRMWKTYE